MRLYTCAVLTAVGGKPINTRVISDCFLSQFSGSCEDASTGEGERARVGKMEHTCDSKAWEAEAGLRI
jgi:hypothetical protein